MFSESPPQTLIGPEMFRPLSPSFLDQPPFGPGGSSAGHSSQPAGRLGGWPAEGSEVATAGLQFMPDITYQSVLQYNEVTHPHLYTAFQMPTRRTTDVVCLLVGGRCPGVITLSPQSVKAGIVNHLSHFHDVPACSAADAPVRDCTWFGCACTQRRARCGGRQRGHTAHVKDLADHIMHSHLDFFYACDLCGRAEWATPYALSRHRQRCRGRVAARCTGCLNLFMSPSALEAHAERGECATATM